MTTRFLAVYETPADPEAFDRHYSETHISLIRQRWRMSEIWVSL
jgi:uncharacterized protein (TIGR02118 family)